MTKFVKLDDDLLTSDAWRFLTPPAKVLYIELKRKFNGSNNGDIFISHRDAAELLSMHRNSISGLYKQLEKVALIIPTSVGKSGPSGIGKSVTWRIAELPMIAAKPERHARKINKSNPPKFTPKHTSEEDDSILDDEVGF